MFTLFLVIDTIHPDKKELNNKIKTKRLSHKKSPPLPISKIKYLNVKSTDKQQISVEQKLISFNPPSGKIIG